MTRQNMTKITVSDAWAYASDARQGGTALRDHAERAYPDLRYVGHRPPRTGLYLDVQMETIFGDVVRRRLFF